ncbi:MAG: cysteine desulfurase family protein [Pseudomonadota bacterium]
MTGLRGNRVYLDWNATAPLRPEARAAMFAALDVVGNPSSVHTEGRAAKSIIETARAQVATLVGCLPEEVVFTSGATEAAAMIGWSFDDIVCGSVEHPCVLIHARSIYPTDRDGRVQMSRYSGLDTEHALQLVNSETGVIQPPMSFELGLVDAVQGIGRIPWRFDEANTKTAIISSHKIGGPKGAGAAIIRRGLDIDPLMVGGGQEQSRRAGTEDVAAIAGFGAAAEAALRDLEDDVWRRVEKLRNILEYRLAEAAPKTIFFGQDAERAPNTTCFAVPGWAGETQVMQMDLAGFAVSAGSACSSGKVQKASSVLASMGFEPEIASSAIRVSMGPKTTEAEVTAFADAWIEQYRRRQARAA